MSGQTGNSRWSRAQVVSWVLVFVWAVVIFAMSARSGADWDGPGLLAQIKRMIAGLLSAITGQPVDPSPVGHFGEFFVFGALLMNAAMRALPTTARAAICSIAIAAVYAVTDELHQIYVPGRFCDPADWLVDVIAATLAVAIVALAFRYRNSFTRSGQIGDSGKHPSQAGE